MFYVSDMQFLFYLIKLLIVSISNAQVNVHNNSFNLKFGIDSTTSKELKDVT